MGVGGEGIIEESFCYDKETQLTVLKTSLFFARDGFTVYNSKGDLVFRVDTYLSRSRHRQIVLMDASGNCFLTVRRKRPSLHQRWEGFLGEKTDGQKPIFSVRRSCILGRSRSSITVEVYGGLTTREYLIEGSFAERCCTVYGGSPQGSRVVVAEIRRKVAPSGTANLVLGKDVFCLSLKPGFDGAFAMGLVLVLDQINGPDYAFHDNDDRLLLDDYHDPASSSNSSSPLSLSKFP